MMSSSYLYATKISQEQLSKSILTGLGTEFCPLVRRVHRVAVAREG